MFFHFRLDDEWIELRSCQKNPIKKRVKLCNLSEEAKSIVARKLFGTKLPAFTPDNNQKPKNTKNGVDISWIKVEQDEESKPSIPQETISKSSEPNSCEFSKRKHSRKYKGPSNNDRLLTTNKYASNFIRPPKGLF